jgi:hypothetical protein
LEPLLGATLFCPGLTPAFGLAGLAAGLDRAGTPLPGVALPGRGFLAAGLWAGRGAADPFAPFAGEDFGGTLTGLTGGFEAPLAAALTAGLAGAFAGALPDGLAADPAALLG